MTVKSSRKNADTFDSRTLFIWLVVFVLVTAVLVLERATPLYINNFYVRLSLYLASATSLIFWITEIVFESGKSRIRTLIFIIAVISVIAKALLTWGGDWKTQIVLYENKSDGNRTVEFQMRADRFAFGYKKRIVERQAVLPFIDYVTDVDTTALSDSDWKRVDKRFNELGLPDFTDQPTY